MCTLIVLRHVVPGQALVVASNRDEYLTRPAMPPRVAAAPTEEAGVASLSFIAPRDLEAGGTWIGLNDAGLFVGLTNRPTQGAPASGDGGVSVKVARSRGLLVRDLLGLPSVGRVREALARVRPEGEPGSSEDPEPGYRPFQLVACDAHEGLHAVLGADARPSLAPLPDGVHVICNRDESDPASSKVSWIRRAVESIDLEVALPTAFDRLVGVLQSHPFGPESLENPCVHRGDYGTRSSTVFACAPGHVHAQAWHAEGAPCRTEYENYTPLLERFQPVGV